MDLKEVMTGGPSTKNRIQVMQGIRKIKEENNAPQSFMQKAIQGVMWLATILILGGFGMLACSSETTNKTKTAISIQAISVMSIFLGFIFVFLMLLISQLKFKKR